MGDDDPRLWVDPCFAGERWQEALFALRTKLRMKPQKPRVLRRLAVLDSIKVVRTAAPVALAARIPVGDRWTLVDLEDAAWCLSQTQWSIRGNKAKNRCYVRVPEPLHRKLMAARTGHVVDHINGDTLDNRKLNLRLCDARGNARNVVHSKNQRKGGYKGVSWSKKARKWQVVFGGGERLPNGKSKLVYVGNFESAEEAARAYDDAARKAFGEYAALNFPDDGTGTSHSPIATHAWEQAKGAE